MTFVTALHVLGATPLFAARAFLAAFLLLSIGRFGPSIPWVGSLPAVQVLASAPAWMLSTPSLLCFGVAAFMEARATWDTDLRLLLGRLEAPVAAAVFLLLQFGLVSGQEAEVLRTLQGAARGAVDPLLAVSAPLGLWVAGNGAIVFLLSVLRHGAISVLQEIDSTGLLDLPRAWSTAETLAVGAATALFVVAPLLAAVGGVVALLSLVVVERVLRRIERRVLVPCGSCSIAVSPMAACCPSCHAATAAPKVPNLLGWPSARVSTDGEAQRMELLALGRCGACATRADGRDPSDRCSACGTPYMDGATRDRFEEAMTRRFRGALPVLVVLSCVPVLGLFPGLLWIRLRGRALARWVPPVRSLALRLAGRVLLVPVFALQGVPILGACALPLWAIVEHRLQRRAFAGRVSAPEAAVAVT